jgi:23S rRNA (uracil1939-C5)-methyltransferase
MTASERRAGEEILEISGLGHHGDGIARRRDDVVYVPFALPGETVRATVIGERATMTGLLIKSPRRADPVCRHFTACGGCVAQHLDRDEYGEWKRGLVVTALAHRGVVCPVDPLVDAHGTGRRRVTLHVRYGPDGARAGFMRQRSHILLDLDVCPILTPALVSASAVARALAAPFAGRDATPDVQLTATETGLDCDIRGAGEPDLETRLYLPTVADTYDLARVTVAGELIVERRAPRMTCGTAVVVPPPGAFLQATGAAEAALAALVQTHAGSASRVADLFCGTGPFALRLAARVAVFAADGNAAAVGALDTAVRRATGLKPVTAVRRDLFRDPLTPDELKPYEAVVFDPPRSGAEAQARALARSAVPAVVAVSCDPASFARDAAILIGGGYRLTRVTPVDQFRYAPHVELVARFARV